MGYKHDERDFVSAGVALAIEDGVSRVTFGRLAKRLGVSDRLIVYYFPTKSDLIGAIVGELGDELRLLLEQAFGDEMLTEDEALQRAWPVLASRQADPVFDILFEMMGLACAGIEPFATLSPLLLEGWIDWLEPRLDLADDVDRRGVVIAALAKLDGLLLLRRMVGADDARRGAARLGIVRGDPID